VTSKCQVDGVETLNVDFWIQKGKISELLLDNNFEKLKPSIIDEKNY
jgi:hypothetical protein